jgi:hypothetical protein
MAFNFEKTSSNTELVLKQEKPESTKLSLKKVTDFHLLPIQTSASAVGILPTFVYKVYIYDLLIRTNRFH